MARRASLLRTREHFGKGRLAADPAESVFINCPFDREFARRFDALVFGTVCCGFLPRSALESGSVAAPRMERITHAVFGCKYSIHDLSRCRGEGEENFARFNMPLELGMAMAQRFLSEQLRWEHDWLLLVPLGHQYLKYLTDLGGFDPHPYDGTVAGIFSKAILWLATRSETVWAPTPRRGLSCLKTFQAAKKRLLQEWGGEVPWADIVLTAQDCAPRR